MIILYFPETLLSPSLSKYFLSRLPMESVKNVLKLPMESVILNHQKREAGAQ